MGTAVGPHRPSEKQKKSIFAVFPLHISCLLPPSQATSALLIFLLNLFLGPFYKYWWARLCMRTPTHQVLSKHTCTQGWGFNDEDTQGTASTVPPLAWWGTETPFKCSASLRWLSRYSIWGPWSQTTPLCDWGKILLGLLAKRVTEYLTSLPIRLPLSQAVTYSHDLTPELCVQGLLPLAALLKRGRGVCLSPLSALLSRASWGSPAAFWLCGLPPCCSVLNVLCLYSYEGLCRLRGNSYFRSPTALTHCCVRTKCWW